MADTYDGNIDCSFIVFDKYHVKIYVFGRLLYIFML